MTTPTNAPSSEVARLLETLELEQWGRLGGRDRYASITFPNHSVALVPPAMSIATWKGMRQMTEEGKA